jgi:hypothetical protein
MSWSAEAHSEEYVVKVTIGIGIAAATLLLALASGLVAFAGSAAAHDRHGPGGGGFQTTMGEAVARMQAAMDLPFSGDPDRDFARMMIPHHQGAIDMAIAELRYGKDERLRRLAQEIIVDQQQEIAVMHLALGEAAPAGTPSPTQAEPVGAAAAQEK